MYCSNCGKKIDDNAKFCQFCGNKRNEINIEDKTDNNIDKNIKTKGNIWVLIFGWYFGIGFICASIVGAISTAEINYIGGFLLCLLGLLCIPPMNKKINVLLKERTDKKKIKIITGIVLFLLIPIVGIKETNDNDNTVNITKTKKSESAIKNDIKTFNKPASQPKIYKAPIEDGSIWSLPTQKGQGYDKTIARYGVSGIKKINSLMSKAANIVALNQACDAVVQVDASDNRSTSENIVMYVDCKNGQRFYLSEKEIISNTGVQSEKEKLIKLMPSHISICEAEIKNSLNYPSTYKKLISKTGFETKEMVNDIVVGFKAKNAFNLELEYEARCMINSNSEISGFGIKEER